ncbi:MAG TPA: carbohydrate-binding protein [Allosphingosinicella sp.]|jgi:hypothetical protein
MALPLIGAAFMAAGTIAGAIGVGVAIAGISLATVLTVVGVGLTGVGLFMLSKKMSKPGSTQNQLNLKLDTQAPVPVAYGRTASGGYLTYRDTYGAKNKYLAMVAVLSAGGPIDAIESFYASDYLVNFSGTPTTAAATATGISPDNGKSKLYKNKLRMRYQLGDAPASLTPSTAIGDTLPGNPGKLSGLAHAVMRLEHDQDAFPQGVPKPLWVIRGVRLYDPRLDSTYPGGSGSHRVNDPTTWAYSENPYLAALNWTLGRYANGKRVYGIGANWDEVDVAAFVTGANVADANNWKVGGVVTTNDDKFAVLGTILQTGGGVPITRGAQISCVVNTPLTSVFTVEEADVVGEIEVVNTTSWRDRINTVTPQYREPSQFWNIISGEIVTSATYVAEDGGEQKSQEVEFPLVQSAAQAHQLAAYELCNTREFLTFNLVGKPKLLNLRVGDSATVNIPEVASSSVKCLVLHREFNPSDQTVSLTLKSETDAKHAFALGQSQTAPPSASLNTYDPTSPDAPGATAWAISATSITNSAGVTIPALVVTGTSDDPYATVVITEYRPFGSTEWIQWSETPRTTTKVEITAVTPGTQYEVAVSYRTNRNILSERRVLGPVTAGVLSVAYSHITGGPNATQGILTNEAHTVAADSSGTVSSFAGAGGTFRVYNGTTEVTTGGSVTYSVPSSTGVTVSINSNGVYSVTAMSADSGTATLRAVYAGTTIDLVYSIAKARAGAAGTSGTSGASAKMVAVSASHQTFSYNSAGTIQTQTTTISAARQNAGAETTQWRVLRANGTVYSDWMTAAATVSNMGGASYMSAPDNDTLTINHTGFQANLAAAATTGLIFEARLNTTTTVGDRISIVKVQDGAVGATGAAGATGATGAAGQNAVVGLLSNEAHSVAADAAGTVSSFTGAGGTFRVFDGTTDKTTSGSVTYSVAASAGVSISINSNGVYSVTAMSADTGTATLRAVYGSVTIDKEYGIAKSKAGAAGSNGAAGATGATGPGGAVIALAPSHEAFTYTDGVLDVSSPSSITFTATKQNTSETVNFTTSPSVTLTGTGDSRTLSSANFGTNRQVVVTATGATSGASDTVTVVRLEKSTAAANASANVTFTTTGTASVTGNSVTFNASGSTFSVKEVVRGPFAASFKLPSAGTNGYVAVQINGQSYGFVFTGAQISAFANATVGYVALDTAATYQFVFDGKAVTFWKDATQIGSDYAVSVTGSPIFALTGGTQGGTMTVTNIQFRPNYDLNFGNLAGPSRPDLYATTGDNLVKNHNLTDTTGGLVDGYYVTGYGGNLNRYAAVTGDPAPFYWRFNDVVASGSSRFVPNGGTNNDKMQGRPGAKLYWAHYIRPGTTGGTVYITIRQWRHDGSTEIGTGSILHFDNTLAGGVWHDCKGSFTLDANCAYFQVIYQGYHIGGVGQDITGIRLGWNEMGATRNAVRGAWLASTAYVVGDVVQYANGSWHCATAHTSNASFPPGHASNTQFISLAIQGNYRDTKFIRSSAQPATPTGTDPSGWSDAVPGGTDALWQSWALKRYDGALVSDWTVPGRITGLTNRGAYTTSTTYYQGDWVTFGGGSYTAITTTVGNSPTGTAQANAYWDVLAAPGATGAPATPASAFTATLNVSATTGTVNLRTLADVAGYTGASDATITFNINGNVTGLSGGGRGIDTGVWPSSTYAIALTVNVASGVTVAGGGGYGGFGGYSGAGGPGSNGGDAIYCSENLTITNAGAIRGGGGGGNGGSASSNWNAGEPLYGAGGGGGGGYPNGSGGGGATGDYGSAGNGASGTTSGGGAGGAGTSYGNAGGTGGGAGAASTSGVAGGYAVRKNGKTVTNATGTYSGTWG